MAAFFWVGQRTCQWPRVCLDSAPEIVEQFQAQTYIPGQFLSLKCVGRGRPPPHFTWTLDGFAIHTDDRSAGIFCIKRNSSLLHKRLLLGLFTLLSRNVKIYCLWSNKYPILFFSSTYKRSKKSKVMIDIITAISKVPPEPIRDVTRRCAQSTESDPSDGPRRRSLHVPGGQQGRDRQSHATHQDIRYIQWRFLTKSSIALTYTALPIW